MRMQKTQSARRSGVTVVEMAFVSLTFFMIMFAIFEYGRYVMARQILQNAARNGARTAVVMAVGNYSTTTANTALNNAVTNALSTSMFYNTQVTITPYEADASGNNIGSWQNTPFGNPLVVQVDADLPLLFPGAGFLVANGSGQNTIHITVKCMMYTEAN